MTTNKQSELGKTLWSIANDLRGAMMADDFRDYMLSFLFWKYLSDNYIKAAQKELGADYHTVTEEKQKKWILRIALYLIGMMVLALGITLNTKTNLGV